MRRDLSTRLFKAGRFSVVLEPRDCWVGVFWSPAAVYVVLVPCVALRWSRVPAAMEEAFRAVRERQAGAVDPVKLSG
ncbi:MAG: hypothetical protein KGJ86_19315 [Chloroflexota bacterium]|nr:hypothetical protein [Chloroflexota bacterium]